MVRLLVVAIFVGVLSITALSQREARAARFDFVAPTEVNVNTGELGIGIGTAAWGLVVATDATIPLVDLENAIVTFSLNDPRITYEPMVVNETFFGPLLPGEVAGYANASTVVDNTSLIGLLKSGETLKFPVTGLLSYGLTFPRNHTGTAELDYSLQIGDQIVQFTTVFTFLPSLPNDYWLVVVGGERISSETVVPEPGTLTLALTATLLATASRPH